MKSNYPIYNKAISIYKQIEITTTNLSTMETTFKNLFTKDLREYLTTHKETLMAIQEMYRETIHDGQGDTMTSTKYVNDKTFRLLKSQTGLDRSQFTKMKIMNVMPMSMCHYNCLFIKERLPNSKVFLGFNLTACECGCFYNLEIHSVLEYEGQLYDFTKDFNGETHKYFIKLVEIGKDENVMFIRNRIMPSFNFHNGFIYAKKEHRCMTSANKLSYCVPQDIVFDEKENINNIRKFFKLPFELNRRNGSMNVEMRMKSGIMLSYS